MVSKEAHQVFNIKWAAIDPGASKKYHPSSYEWDNHNPLAPKVTVGCANNTAIKSKAQDTIHIKKLPTKSKFVIKLIKNNTITLSKSTM